MTRSGRWFLLVTIPVLLVFGQVISFEFLKYDDTINVSENALLLNPSTGHLLSFWRAPFLELYIPVTYSAWSGAAAVSKAVFNGRLDPGLFHLMNLLAHAANCWLLFLVIGRLSVPEKGPGNGGRALAGAALGALVFGLHPVQAEAVSWITGFKGLLGGFFSLGAMYFYLGRERDPGGNRTLNYVVSTALLVLAILSMPSGVAVPVMVFFILIWRDGRMTWENTAPLVPWLVIGLAAVVITRAAQPVPAGAAEYPWLIRPLVALDAVLFYARKIVWPGVLAIDYCRTPAFVAGLSWRNPYLLMAIPAAALVYALRRRPRWLAMGGAFIAGILPVAGLVPFAYQETSTVADRYLYLSMAVIAMASSAVIAGKPRPWVIGLFAALVVFLGAGSYGQCRKWKNTESVMGHTLRYYPCSYRANLNYGIALMSRGDFAGAMPFYEAAGRLKPDDPLSYYNLGLACAAAGDDDRCRQLWRTLETMDKAKADRLKQAAAEFKTLGRPEGVAPVPDGGGRTERRQP
jgi:hypothetical protein